MSEVNDHNDGITKKDILKMVGCIVFLALSAIAMAFIFILLIQWTLSMVGWMIWGV